LEESLGGEKVEHLQDDR